MALLSFRRQQLATLFCGVYRCVVGKRGGATVHQNGGTWSKYHHHSVNISYGDTLCLGISRVIHITQNLKRIICSSRIPIKSAISDFEPPAELFCKTTYLFTAVTCSTVTYLDIFNGILTTLKSIVQCRESHNFLCESPRVVSLTRIMP